MSGKLFELRNATIDDVEEIITVRDVAFKGTSNLSTYCFPDTPAFRAFSIEGLRQGFDDPSRRMIKYVDTQSEKILGFAIWYVPAKRPDGSVYTGGATKEELAQLTWPPDCDGALNNEVFTNFAKHRVAIMGDRPHYYLELLAVNPESRGCGAGRRLIEWGLNQADEAGLEAYIEALDQVIPLYEKFGWKKVSTYTHDGIKHTETFMRRDITDVNARG